jgi:hypothetical protein
MRIKIFTLFLVISLTFVINPALASKEKQAQYGLQKASVVFSDLMQALSSRPNVTTSEIEKILERVNRHSGQAMFAKLAKTHHPKQIKFFASNLRSYIDSFEEDYSNAALDSEVRAAITNEFYLGVLDAAEQSGISYEQFILAFFKAGATLEKGLEKKSTISLADRELTNLLLASTSYQLQFRSYFRNLFDAFTVIEPVPFPRWPNILSNLQLAESIIHTVFLASLEEILIDPLILADAVALHNQQFNLAAQSDITSFSIYLNLHMFVGDDNSFLTELAERMSAIGGVMAEMDIETLVSSGVLSDTFLLAPEATIYNWVNPDLKVKYRPVKAIPYRLETLGADIRTSPDFGLFENPYLAFFQLAYDSALIHDLLMHKWHQLGDAVLSIEMRLANMEERYELRRLESRLKVKSFKRLRGINSDEKNALRSLLKVPFFF